MERMEERIVSFLLQLSHVNQIEKHLSLSLSLVYPLIEIDKAKTLRWLITQLPLLAINYY
jgi:hypothetical protein